MAETQTPCKRKVMLCVDGSAHCKTTFDWYLENVSHPEDHIYVVHAPELHPPALPHAMATEQWKEEVEKHKKKVDAIVAEYKTACEEAVKANKISHAVVEFKSVGYSVGQTLCDVAKKEQVTLVVIGSRGMGVIRRTLLGSVSDYVIHHAHCPVVVVPKH